MGMYAQYTACDDATLAQLKTLSVDDLIDTLDEAEETESLPSTDIDKMWDGLHFVLTGVSANNPIEDNLLSIAILGDLELVDDEDFFNTYTVGKGRVIYTFSGCLAFVFWLHDDLAAFADYQEPCGFAVPCGILDNLRNPPNLSASKI